MSESWIINSDHSEAAFISHVKKLREEHKYVTFGKPRLGQDRSLGMNALLHVWLTEYAAFLLKKDKRTITSGEIEGMKFMAKKRFNHLNSNNFMVHDIVDPFTGKTKKGYTSSATWKHGEMFVFLEWLQMYAANDGFILESKGQYDKLKREQNS